VSDRLTDTLNNDKYKILSLMDAKTNQIMGDNDMFDQFILQSIVYYKDDN